MPVLDAFIPAGALTILGENARTAAITKLAARRRKNAVAILSSALTVEPKVSLESL